MSDGKRGMENPVVVRDGPEEDEMWEKVLPRTPSLLASMMAAMESEAGPWVAFRRATPHQRLRRRWLRSLDSDWTAQVEKGGNTCGLRLVYLRQLLEPAFGLPGLVWEAGDILPPYRVRIAAKQAQKWANMSACGLAVCGAGAECPGYAYKDRKHPGCGEVDLSRALAGPQLDVWRLVRSGSLHVCVLHLLIRAVPVSRAQCAPVPGRRVDELEEAIGATCEQLVVPLWLAILRAGLQPRRCSGRGACAGTCTLACRRFSAYRFAARALGQHTGRTPLPACVMELVVQLFGAENVGFAA